MNVKERKKHQIVNIIHIIRPMTRQDIAKYFNTPVPNIIPLIKELISEEKLCENGFVKPNGGRRQALLEISHKFGYAIGINSLNSIDLNIVLIDAKGKILSQVKEPYNSVGNDYKFKELIKKNVSKVISESKINSEKIKGIGIGVPGIINRGKSIFPPLERFWHTVDLQGFLSKEFKLEVSIANDIYCAASGELWFGEGKGLKNWLYIYLGELIGLGIVADGKVYKGIGNAGEFGHITVENNGTVCYCGNYGCLETVASGDSILRKVKEELDKGITSEVLSIAKDIESIKLEDIVEASKRGDRLCNNILEKAGEYLGLQIANLVNILNPEIIVLSGSLVYIENPVIEQINRFLKTKTLLKMENGLKIITSKLKDDSGSIGAATLILEKLFAGDCPRMGTVPIKE